MSFRNIRNGVIIGVGVAIAVCLLIFFVQSFTLHEDVYCKPSTVNHQP